MSGRSFLSSDRARRCGRFGWLVALLAVIALTGALGCQELIGHRKRKFGASCGNPTECESGVCTAGVCSQSCGSDSDCGGDLCIESFCQPQESDLDGDGLANGDEKAIGTNPDGTDSDSDGIDDGIEVGPDVHHPKDSNGDGIPDALQSNLKDEDGDCIVDALDKDPKSADALPNAQGVCNQGVCAANIGQAKLVCDVKAQGTSVVGLAVGCTGCICEAPGVADWQATETFCDQLDNDCDGQTDEDLTWNSFPLGSPCHADKGICAVSAAGVLQKSGKVECGTDKVATCSTLADGHESLAMKELCNGLDDNCDGQTDEDFLWQNHHVGESCADICGGTALYCDDKKSQIGGAVVRCLDEKTATCAGKPFASGFVQLGQGAPQPRREWTAGLIGEDKLVLFSGKTPAAEGLVLRDETWTLDVSGLKQGLSITQPWQHAIKPGPLPRVHAALVWDAPHNRSLLIGGDAGNWTPDIWSIAPSGAATEVSALPLSDPLAIPPLLDAKNLPNENEQLHTQAVILTGPGGHRSLLVVAPNLSVPMELPLSPTAVVEWKPAPTLVNGAIQVMPIQDAMCLTATPDGTAAVLVQADGTAWWIVDDGESPVLHRINGQGQLSKVARTAAMCAIDNADILHLMGGESATNVPPDYVTADLSTIPNDVTPSLPNDITWTGQPPIPALQRAGGFALWHAASQTIVFGGGYQSVTTSTGTHHVGVADVWAFSPVTNTPTRLDTAVPGGRIGAAQAWRPVSAQWCLAGGLMYDLPDQLTGLPRAVPVTDAWCVAGNGAWTQVGTNVLFAFGMAGIDQKADRFVLAGGFDLKAGEEVPDLQRMWTGGLLPSGQTSLEALWVPTKAVRTLDLQTHALVTTPSTGAYGLSASSVAMDPLRNRLIISGGFDAQKETHQFLTLDLATLNWTDVGAKVPALGVCGGPCHPVDRYGAPIVYDPVHDILGITAGSIRTSGGSVGEDTGVFGDVGCFGFLGNTLWLGTTGILSGTPSFAPSYVPDFAEGVAPTGNPGSNCNASQTPAGCYYNPQTGEDATLTCSAASGSWSKVTTCPSGTLCFLNDQGAAGCVTPKPLLQQYFGGPAFVPVLFDWLGGRAWMAPQARAIPAFGGPGGTACPAASTQAWTTAGVQVSLAVGLCQPPNPQSIQAHLEQQTITAPTALIHAAAYFDVPTQTGWLFGGMEPDGSVASGLWQLAETCVK